jgi:hypothetical protein
VQPLVFRTVRCERLVRERDPLKGEPQLVGRVCKSRSQRHDHLPFPHDVLAQAVDRKLTRFERFVALLLEQLQLRLHPLAYRHLEVGAQSETNGL